MLAVAVVIFIVNTALDLLKGLPKEEISKSEETRDRILGNTNRSEKANSERNNIFFKKKKFTNLGL